MTEQKNETIKDILIKDILIKFRYTEINDTSDIKNNYDEAIREIHAYIRGLIPEKKTDMFFNRDCNVGFNDCVSEIEKKLEGK